MVEIGLYYSRFLESFDAFYNDVVTFSCMICAFVQLQMRMNAALMSMMLEYNVDDDTEKIVDKLPQVWKLRL